MTFLGGLADTQRATKPIRKSHQRQLVDDSDPFYETDEASGFAANSTNCPLVGFA